MLLLFCGLSLFVSEAVAATPAISCLQAFSLGINTQPNACETVEKFALCLEHADQSGPMDHLFGVLARAQQQHDCQADLTFPDASIIDGEAAVEMSGKDIRFRRDANVASIFELQSRINMLKSQLSNIAISTTAFQEVQQRVSQGVDMNSMKQNVDQVFNDALTGIKAVVTTAAAQIDSDTSDDADTLISTIITPERLHDAQIAAQADISRVTMMQQQLPSASSFKSGIDAEIDTVKDNIPVVNTLTGSTSTAVSQRFSQTTAKMNELKSKRDQFVSRVSKRKTDFEAVSNSWTTALTKFNTDTATFGKLPVFSAFCNRHNRNTYTWTNYCMTNIEFNTADSYLKLEDANAGRIRIKKAGLYRVNSWVISNCASWAHFNIYINGYHRHYGHEYGYNTWIDNKADATFPMKINDAVEIKIYCTGGWGAHHSGNVNGAYGRFQITYLGAYHDATSIKAGP